MKQNTNTSCLRPVRLIIIAILTIMLIAIAHCVSQVEAKRSHMIEKSKRHGHKHHNAPAPQYGDDPAEASMFNVLSFGAKGDGVSDNSKVCVHIFFSLLLSACAEQWSMCISHWCKTLG